MARTIWLLRDTLLPLLTADQTHNVARWLGEAEHARVPDNNWHLYPVLIDVVLSDLGWPSDRTISDAHLARVDSFRRSGGWYSDGAGDQFDWYNVWSFQYEFFGSTNFGLGIFQVS